MMSYKNRIAKAQELLESVDLWEKKDFPITYLSHGEQRQIEIILALSSQPKLLLLDEPSAGLTRDESNKLSQTLRELMEDTAVLFVAHDLDLVRDLADRILVLYYGSILADGTPEEIQKNQRVHEVYLGTETKVA
jgi:branched-chain amino acid transport system ATP-binding protein